MLRGSTQIDLFSFYFATVGYFVSLTVIVGDLRLSEVMDFLCHNLGLGKGEMDELKGPHLFYKEGHHWIS
jgi:hypothetical protein